MRGAVTAKAMAGPERLASGAEMPTFYRCVKRNPAWRFLTFVRRAATLFRASDADPVLPPHRSTQEMPLPVHRADGILALPCGAFTVGALLSP
ncbi:hypothetical protein GCM10022600_06060 [Qipengyuania pelagi]